MGNPYGRPIGSGVRPITERFWEKVAPPDARGCFCWIGLKTAKGYGRFGTYRRGMVLAHRFAWELVHGEIRGDECVLHRCDTPACVNHEHLFLGSRQDNNEDMRQKGRSRRAMGDASGRRKYPERYPVGSEWPMAKLTEAKVRRLRADYEAGKYSFAALGKKYGIGHTTAENIVKRRKWKHV